MKNKLLKSLAAMTAIMVLSVSGQHQAIAADMELVIGTGSIKGNLFAAGNAMSVASVLQGKGVKVYNYGTKGGKDNIKRISKKKRAINFGLVTAGDLGKAKKKQLNAIRGLMAIGESKGKTMLLIVRNKAPKKVSKADYAAAVAQIVNILKSKKGIARIKAAWKGYAPASGATNFKSVGVKLHNAAIM
jgi:hypothetical protein